MTKTIYAIVTSIALSFLISGNAAANPIKSKSASVFDVELRLTMSDGRVYEPKVTVASGKQARLTFNDATQENPAVQLRLVAVPRTLDTFSVSVQVLELRDRNWVILNEAEAAGYLGKTMYFGVGSDAQIELTGKQVTDDKVKVDNLIEKPTCGESSEITSL